MPRPRKRTVFAILISLLAITSVAEAASDPLLDACTLYVEPDAAIKACTQILDLKQEDADRVLALTMRALAFQKKDDLDAAIEDLTRVLEIDPKNARALSLRGGIYYSKHDLELARIDLAKAVELDPSNAMTKSLLGLVEQSAATATMVSQFSQKMPDLKDSLEAVGLSLEAMGLGAPGYSASVPAPVAGAPTVGSPAAALASSTKEPTVVPTLPTVKVPAPSTAPDLSPPALPFSPTPQPAATLASQSSATASQAQADCLDERTPLGQRIDACTRAIDLDPKNAKALLARARAYNIKGRFDLALADQKRADELGPEGIRTSPPPQQAAGDKVRPAATPAAPVTSPTSEQADCLDWRTPLGQRIGACTRAIELDPNNANALLARARAYMIKGQYDLALADSKKAGALGPDSLRGDAKFIENAVANSLANSGGAPSPAPVQQAAVEPVKPAPQPAPSIPAPSPQPVQQDAVEPAKPPITAPSIPAPSPQPVQQASTEPSPPAPQPAAPTSSSAPLGKRVALVIGNSDYKNTTPLPNPSNDARDVAAALKRLGFTVIEEKDLDKRGMDDAFRRFARDMAGADTAMFYYAGHAMEWQGANYLMPVDAKLEDEADVPYEMAKLNDMIADMGRVKAVRIAVLDACRNNPLEDRLKRSIALTRGGAQTRGLARIEKAEGLVVAYATQSGNVAEDGGGRNSPFTTALLQYIETPGLEVGVLFRRVMGSVKQATQGKQHPELSILLDSEFYFKPGS